MVGRPNDRRIRWRCAPGDSRTLSKRGYVSHRSYATTDQPTRGRASDGGPRGVPTGIRTDGQTSTTEAQAPDYPAVARQAPNVLAALKPCWAMSPLLVSQLLPAERCFDVCIFDEASQVTPAGAVGALTRAHHAIVAGDPHQLPPTAFFASSADESEEDDGDYSTALVEGLESILDVMGALLPPPNGTKTLEWHYRSRDERLIAFSNAQQSLYDCHHHVPRNDGRRCRLSRPDSIRAGTTREDIIIDGRGSSGRGVGRRSCPHSS